jgi:rhodanese-related sulfurtransferase
MTILKATEFPSPSSEAAKAFTPGLLMTREELRSRLNDASLVIVNVLPKEAFRAEHISRSISLPVAEINDRARLVLPDVAPEICVYCASPA